MKLLLVYRKALKLLNLKDYKVYSNNARKTSILKLEKKNPINAVFPWLTPGVCTATTLQQALIDPLELQFVPSPGLSNKSHNYAYARKVIALNKLFNIFPRAYCLDTLFLPVFTTEVVEEIARRYFCLLLAQSNNFHRAQVKHKIVYLNIIVAQAANQAFVLKTTLGRI